MDAETQRYIDSMYTPLPIVLNGVEYTYTEIVNVMWEGDQDFSGYCDADQWVVIFKDNSAILFKNDGSMDDDSYELFLDLKFPT